MTDKQKQAWDEAREDHQLEQASALMALWKVFWTLVFLSGGAGGAYYAISRMFNVEAA